MTTREEVIAYFQSAEPTELREVLAKVADAFSEKAEALYDKNPEENGLLAQPYADIADHLGEASLVFESQTPGLDAQPVAAQTTPTPTVSQVVASQTKGSPWGGR